MVSSRSIIKGMASTVAIAAASITGGPIVGAQVAAFLASPPGQALLDKALDQSAANQGVVLDDLAMGGLVSYPTLGLTGEDGPEMVIPLKKKPRSRKQKAQDKKKSIAWKKANDDGRKNNGDFRSGWNQKRVAERANKILKRL